MTASKSNLKAARTLFEENHLEDSLFYLSQAFEMANKSLLAHIRSVCLKENDLTVESILRNLRHDKRRLCKEIIKYFKKLDNSKNLDLISKTLNTSIDYYAIHNTPKGFARQMLIDSKKLEEIDGNKTHCLFNLYHASNVYKYQIDSYILARYFDNIEGLVRYPEKDTFFIIDSTSKTAVSKLVSLTGRFIEDLLPLFRCNF